MCDTNPAVLQTQHPKTAVLSTFEIDNNFTEHFQNFLREKIARKATAFKECHIIATTKNHALVEVKEADSV